MSCFAFDGVRRLVASVTLALSAITLAAGPVAAADNDPRIVAAPTECNAGLLSTVRIVQPFVYGNRSTPETIYWYPVLQRWTGSTWLYEDAPPTWIRFSATNQGSLDMFADPRNFVFTPKYRNAYYRIFNVIYWGSTGESGNKASAWCFLQ